MSKLIVKVQQISKIYKHPNADRLNIVEMEDNDWKCITNRDDYAPGDLAVFVPIDSLMPEKLIDKYNLDYLKKNNVVKTVKLRGIYSQGLLLPNDGNHKLSTNVAEYLGITKFEPKEPDYQKHTQKSVSFKHLVSKLTHGQITFGRFLKKSLCLIKDKFKPKKNPNPYFTKYTDIENIKNYPNVFTDTDEVSISEKCHGTNARFGNLPKYPKTFIGKIKAKLFGTYTFVYGSHNIQKNLLNRNKGYYDEDVYGKIAKKYNLAEIIPEDCVLYGEILGPNIQKGFDYGLEEVDILFFDVKYRGSYLDPWAFKNFFQKYDLPTVPILYTGKFTKEIVEKYTIGKSVIAEGNNQDLIREGCVIKARSEIGHPAIGRQVLKSINPAYLLLKNTEYH